MEFLHLSTEKNIKTLKPDELTGRIYFYSTIEACLYNQKLHNKPGKYYVYKQDELQFNTSGSVSFSDVSFSDEINVSCIGCIEYKGLHYPGRINCTNAIGINNFYPGYDYKWIERKIPR